MALKGRAKGPTTRAGRKDFLRQRGAILGDGRCTVPQIKNAVRTTNRPPHQMGNRRHSGLLGEVRLDELYEAGDGLDHFVAGGFVEF